MEIGTHGFVALLDLLAAGQGSPLVEHARGRLDLVILATGDAVVGAVLGDGVGLGGGSGGREGGVGEGSDEEAGSDDFDHGDRGGLGKRGGE
jgi:hypothetical protein